MTINLVIINPRQEMGWSVDDAMPGRNGPEDLRIFEKESVGI